MLKWSDWLVNVTNVNVCCVNCQEGYSAPGQKRAYPTPDTMNEALAAFYGDSQSAAKQPRFSWFDYVVVVWLCCTVVDSWCSVTANILCLYWTRSAVWFTLTETEISVNGKIWIPLTETKEIRKMEKFDMETDKFGYVHFRFRCISVSRHHTGFR